MLRSHCATWLRWSRVVSRTHTGVAFHACEHAAEEIFNREEDTEANGNGQIIARSNKLSGERYVG